MKNVVYREEDGGRRNSAWDDTSSRAVWRSEKGAETRARRGTTRASFAICTSTRRRNTRLWSAKGTMTSVNPSLRGWTKALRS